MMKRGLRVLFFLWLINLNYIFHYNIIILGLRIWRQFMKFDDNTILILPSLIKDRVIKEIRNNNSLLDIKFMTIDEFIKNYYFDYGKEAVNYLMNKYNYKYDVACVYLNNLYFIKDYFDYDNPKLLKLKDIKKELDDNGLLIYNSLFKNYIKNKSIVVYGFDSLDKLERDTFESLDNVQVIYNKCGDYKHSYVYEFNNLEDEVNYVCIKIIDLINDGVDINKIKLLNVTNEYNNTLSKIFGFYNIPIDIDSKVSLYSTEMGSYFISKLDDDINITFDKVKNKFNIGNELNLDIYNKLIKIINEYTWVSSYKSVKDMIINDLKNTYVCKNKFNNCIELVSIKNNIFYDDNYYFLLNFNQGSIPKIHMDEDYITDNIKNNVLVDKTSDSNRIAREDIIQIFSRIYNLVITYKLHSLSGEYNISNINDDLKLEIIRDFKDEYKYSNMYNKLRLASKLDDRIKYNINDGDIGILYSSYPNIKYLSYDNKFTGLAKSKLYSYLDNKLLLSYSTIDNFNRCGFRYYISNILKLSIFEDTFMTVLGSLFHHVLEFAFKDEIDIDYEYDKYIGELDRKFDSKEKFFLGKLKSELKFIISSIKEQLEECSLNKCLYEEKIYIDKSKKTDIKITFMGIIDKMMYKEEGDRCIVSIIDYKTGNPKIDLNTSIYGIEMQLPIYLYLASNSNKVSNVRFAGFYLQKVLNNEIVKDYKSTYDDLKKKNLRLQGYSNSDINVLSKFDQSYMDSRVIKSMKTTSKGFSSYAKVIDDEKMEKLIDIVDKGIDDSIDKILECQFDINPKKIGIINYGCEFCKYRDICFRSNNDIVNLKEYKKMEFLEDEEV